MAQNEEIKAFIDEFGLTNLARTLTEKTNRKFSAQQVYHWRKRGVPYKWQDLVKEVSGIPKNKLR